MNNSGHDNTKLNPVKHYFLYKMLKKAIVNLIGEASFFVILYIRNEAENELKTNALLNFFLADNLKIYGWN
jgi:hypothetical protein